jgi:DNA-binding transcriptional ArsR family regulator
LSIQKNYNDENSVCFMKIAEEIRISDLETLKVISAPLRVQILERIGLASEAGHLTTVKQLSEDLDIPPTKLYYHINLLEKHGLIQIAETKVVSGIIEKYYQIAAKRIRADLDISKNTTIDRNEGMALTLSSLKNMFAKAYTDLEKSFQHRLRVSGGEEQETTRMLSTQAMLQLSTDEAQHFIDEMSEIIEKYGDINNPNGLTFGLTLVFNPNYHLKREKLDPEPVSLGQISVIDDKPPRIPPQL